MRWYSWSGFVCLVFSLAIIAVLLFYPQSQNTSVTAVLLDGTPVQVTVTVADRGWVKQANKYSLQVSTPTETGKSSLQLWARLEMTGQQINPQGISERIIQPGDKTTFKWSAISGQRGVTPGVLWLYQSEGSGEKSLLYAKEFSFSAHDFWGISIIAAQIAAAVFFLLGIGLIWLGRKKNIKPLLENPGNLVS
jgi:hypothetical protein